jgi:Ca2+-binding RTX toxin-like protein
MTSSVTSRCRRGLFAIGVLLAVLALTPASASATGDPIARSTCSAPGLTCDPCPHPLTHCAQPTGEVAVGVPVSFDGRQSSDDRGGVIDGTVVAWSWDFGDGDVASGAQVTHAFTGAAPHTVQLTATDDDDNTDTHQLTIVVVGTAIVATPSPGIVIGTGTLSDQAQVNGRTSPTAGATIDFKLFGPNDTLCAGTPLSRTTVPYPADGGIVTAAPYTPVQTGVHRWTVAYSGDANNPPIPGRCNDATQNVLVSAVTPPPPAPPPPPPPSLPSCFGKPATIVVSAASDRVTGTPGRDVIVGSSSPDTIDGRGGNDLICAGKGRDRVIGGLGDDKIRGGAGDDDLRGGSGKDRMAGDDGVDRVDGGAGNDDIDEQALGGKGRDRLVGGAGNDRIRTADKTTDSIDCGAGSDSVLKDTRDRQSRCERVVSRK